jgi:serine protease AprX
MQHSDIGRHFSLSLAAAVMAAAGACVSVHAGTVPQPWVEFNSMRYHIQKVEQTGGEVVHVFYDGQRSLTWEQLEAHVAAQEPRKIAPRLEAVLEGPPLRAGELIETIVVLRHQPAEPIAREVWGAIADEREALASGMREITGRPLARPSVPEFLMDDFVPLPLTREEVEERRALAAQLDDLERRARQEIYTRTAAAIGPLQDEVAVTILELGGEITARITAMNILGARLPAAAIGVLAENPLVAIIDLDHPGEPELDISAQALMVNSGFWANNITGGIFDAGVLDTGVQMNHPDLASHPYLTNMSPPGTDSGDHGTHVAGIMVSTNPVHRGMAFGADKIVYARAGNDSTSMSGMSYMASTGEPDVCNYSFGNGTASTNDYANIDRFFDGVISTFSYLVSKSTGNGGFGTGNPTITHPAPAFNLLAVANLNDMNTPTRADDWIASSSSRGPTAGGRKKPDIAAPGSNIMSANKNWATGSNFINKTGTSMAAPHVGGAVLLLYDMGVNNTMAAKAVLINTADATEDNNTSGTADDYRVQGSRWNRRYGWGYMHLGRAYLNGLNVFQDSVSTASPEARVRFYAGQMFEHEKATLVWQRHVAFNGASYPTQVQPLSDLDLFAYREGANALVASSTSAIDNVEQLSIPPGGAGYTVLKVKAIGSFGSGISQEHFAIATQENFAAKIGPSFDIELQHPVQPEPQSTFTISANITNDGDLTAHGVSIELVDALIVSGSNPVFVGNLAANQSVPVQWTVAAAPDPGAYPFTVNITSNSYGEQLSAAETSSYLVASEGTIITNMPGNDGAQSTNLSDGRIKAMGFTMPAGDDYVLDEVQLRLNLASVAADPLVRIFDDVQGLPTNQLITLANPPLNQTGISTYSFTPPAPFTLEADTAYWLVVYNLTSGTTASMGWVASSPAQIPLGIAVHSGSLWNGDTGPNPPYSPSAIINSYTVMGTSASGCYANCDGSTTEPILNVEDFTCFINQFAAALGLPPSEQLGHYANCDGSTTDPVLNVEDFICFIDQFASGCP